MADFYKDVPEDFQKNYAVKKRGLMDKTASFAMNSAALRFGTYNYGTPEWDKRNAHQHLIWTVLNPRDTQLHEIVDTITDKEFDNQDIHNNKLKNKIINRANELDARKGKKNDTPTEDSVEQASFNMIKEQEKRLEQGLMQSPTLPWIDTSKDMPGYDAVKTSLYSYIPGYNIAKTSISSIKDAALNISKQFFK